MNEELTIPRPGHVLRAAIKAAGYRCHLEGIGLDKDLDDCAIESRPGVTSELMQKIEDACSKSLSADCGSDWAQFLRMAWVQARKAIQTLAQHVDGSPLINDHGNDLVLRLFSVPMLSGFSRLCFATHRGPEIDLWWKSPFLAWIHFASSKAGMTTDVLITNLANSLGADERTIERWLAGDPIGKLTWPFRLSVQEAIGKQQAGRVGEAQIDHLAGWLMLAVAFQSLPHGIRDAVRRDFGLRSQEPWSLEEAILTMNQHALTQGDSPTRRAVVPLLQCIEELFAEKQRNLEEIKNKLEHFDVLIQQEGATAQLAYRYIHDWFAGRVAALEGKQEKALRHYAAAVSGAWWRAGANQHPILNEALLYAVGVGDKVAAENYWDKTFVLGLNAGPKRLLDEQELRRIAFGFEKMFFPQKAKARIPPPIEIIVQDEEFVVGAKHLANPNQKAKFAEGRTRRTPLMEAIRDGSLDDVKRLLDAGGDPNDYIKESGEGPLSYAMRRACDRKDPLIMEHLLTG